MKSKHTIALVDDDSRLLDSLGNFFDSAGYDVRCYLSGHDLIAAGLNELDCIITDIGMPNMNGFDLHDTIKTSHPTIPVFLLTGRHEIGDQKRAARTDIAGLFRKPFDGPTLLAAVALALRKPPEQ